MRRYTPLFILLAAIPLFFWKLAFTNLIFARGDTFFYFYPYWGYRAQALLAGEVPLWNPYLFMGAPLLANPQAGVLYPLNWPLVFFAAPVAVKIAILLHLGIAALGTFALARRLRLSPTAATLAALLFALGGHMTAKVEQVNQLQGLAWLPWLLLALDTLLRAPRSDITESEACPERSRRVSRLRPTSGDVGLRKRSGLALAALLALQLLAGHTQTTFISLVALGVWWLACGSWRDWRNLAYPGLFLALGVLLAAAQLLPTLELSQHSFRSGGLSFNEAVSFSLNPLLLGRSLLPGYSHALFSEFVGYLGVIGLLLAIAGLSRITHRVSRFTPWRSAAILAGLGLLFALGGFNPLYWLLVRFAPGFDLFRAPARWLALWALGGALLAGRGFDSLGELTRKQRKRIAAWTAGIILALITLTFASAGLTPPGEAGPLGQPALVDVIGWLSALGIGGLVFVRQAFQPVPARTGKSTLLIALAAELFLASIRLPLNNLTTPDAYSSIRPAMTQLLAARDDATPPGRFLSMTTLVFDPGDLTELRGILEPQLPERAVFDAIVATKAKEVLSPNLPLAWNVPAVDGYDGGVLPLRAYAQFAQQFTGAEVSSDGRLREYVTETPPNWLLNVTNTRWLITDKVGDAWLDDVFYDLQFEAVLEIGGSVEVGYVPTFEATAVGLVVSADGVDLADVGQLQIILDNGSLLRKSIPRQLAANGAGRVLLGGPATPKAIAIESAVDGLIVRGVSLVDERSGAFQSLALGPYRLAHSGDVKIYENLNVFPRAYLVSALPLTPDTPTTGQTTIRDYSPNRIVIDVNASEKSFLVLADAMYPGWQATIDDERVEIQAANSLFRAVEVTTGKHEVIFEFQSTSWTLGVWTSVGALVVWGMYTRVRVSGRSGSRQ